MILVECTCDAKKFEVEPNLAGGIFVCENCNREIRVPKEEWAREYSKWITKTAASNEHDRVHGYQKIVELGTENALPALMRGVYDGSRDVVNTCLIGMIEVGPVGHAQLLDYFNKKMLAVSRLVAAIREESYWDAAPVLSRMIDEGRFNENQTSEMIPLLSEAGSKLDPAERQRCIDTLKALRKVFPNLAMIIDNALANYRRFDSQVVKIPEDAKHINDEERVDRVAEMAVSQRTENKKGCLMSLALLISFPLLSLVGGAMVFLS